MAAFQRYSLTWTKSSTNSKRGKCSRKGISGERTFSFTPAQSEHRSSAGLHDSRNQNLKETVSNPPIILFGAMGELELVELTRPDLSTPWFADVNVQTLAAQTNGNWGLGIGTGLEVGRGVARPGSTLDVYLTGEFVPMIDDLGGIGTLKTLGVGLRYRF